MSADRVAELRAVKTFDDAIEYAKRHGPLIDAAGNELPALPERGESEREQLAADIAAFIARYVWHRDDTLAIVLTLWVLHSYAVEAFPRSPRVILNSPYMHGKSRVLDVMRKITSNPTSIGYATTPATIYRRIEQAHIDGEPIPTVFLDESVLRLFDGGKLRVSDPNARTIFEVLLAGYDCNGTVPRTETDWKVRDYRAFAPTMLAGAGAHDPALESRSIVLPTERYSGEIVFPDEDTDALAASIGERAGRLWRSETALAELRRSMYSRDRQPAVPEAFAQHPRLRDVWRPLFAIADAIGPAWSRQARITALELAGLDDGEAGEATSSPLDEIDAAIRNAIERGFINPKSYTAKRRGMAWVSRWEHDGRIELRMRSRDYPMFYEKVRAANRGMNLPGRDEVKRLYRNAGRLRHRGRNLAANLSVWHGQKQTECVAIDVTQLFKDG